jgi:hypothetical protein
MITNQDIAMLMESWEKLLPFIPAKDREDAAMSFVTLLDDYSIDEQSIVEIKQADEHLEKALNEYYQEEESIDDDWKEDEDW